MVCIGVGIVVVVVGGVGGVLLLGCCVGVCRVVLLCVVC